MNKESNCFIVRPVQVLEPIIICQRVEVPKNAQPWTDRDATEQRAPCFSVEYLEDGVHAARGRHKKY